MSGSLLSEHILSKYLVSLMVNIHDDCDGGAGGGVDHTEPNLSLEYPDTMLILVGPSSVSVPSGGGGGHSCPSWPHLSPLMFVTWTIAHIRLSRCSNIS